MEKKKEKKTYIDRHIESILHCEFCKNRQTRNQPSQKKPNYAIFPCQWSALNIETKDK